MAAFALVGMPFLLGRATRRDYFLATCAGAFVVAYVGYFYHGISLGPRYYFEAVPALALLAARGIQASVQTLHARAIRSSAMEMPLGDLVVVDECHHVRARSWRRILDEYPEAIVIGLSATPDRYAFVRETVHRNLVRIPLR